MSVTPIVCQNCGAKYKLPASFTADKAKCKACGAVIDVAAQRPASAAEAEPPTPPPPAPVVEAPKPEPKPEPKVEAPKPAPKPEPKVEAPKPTPKPAPKPIQRKPKPAASKPTARRAEPKQSEEARPASPPRAAKPVGARPAAARKPVEAEEAAEETPVKPTRSRSAGGRSAGGRKRAGGAARRGRRDAEPEVEVEAEQGDEAPARGRRAAGGGRGRRGAKPEKKKGNQGVLIGGGIGLVAIIAVVLVFVMGGGEDPTAGEQQVAGKGDESTPTAEQTAEAAVESTEPVAEAAPEQPVEEPTEPAAAAPAETSPTGDAPAEEATAEETAAEKTPVPAKDRPAPTKRNVKEITSEDEVFNVKSETYAIEWPDEASAEERGEIEGLVALIYDEEFGWTKAKPKLAETGYYGAIAIVNKLRELDYFDEYDAMKGAEFNQLLEQLTEGINARYRPPVMGKPQSLNDVDWNCKTVREWIKLVGKYSDSAAWDEMVKGRAKKRAE